MSLQVKYFGVIYSIIEVLSRQRCRVLRKGKVRGDKEDHHSSFEHNPESNTKRPLFASKKTKSVFESMVTL